MALNITAIWEALFDTAPTGAQLATFGGEDASQGDAATIASIIATPAVQQDVIPVIQIIQLATGLAPTEAQLTAWSAAAASEGLLAVAQAWVTNSNFQAQYGSTSVSIINGIYAKAFGVVPTSQQVTAWSADTPAQILLAFATSAIYTNTLASHVTVYLTDLMEDVSAVPPIGLPVGSLITTFVGAPPPPVTQSFTLTTSQDSVISGQDTVNTTTPGVEVQSTGNVTVNAPLSGPFNLLTLSPGDDINLAGTNNVLDASFHGSSVVNGVTILGAQTWNITQLGGNGSIINIEGNAGALDGLTTLTYTGNGINSSTLQVGLAGHTVDATTAVNGFNLSATNIGFDSNLIVFLNAGSFSGHDQINVTANQVGNTTGTTSTSIITSTFFEAGSGGAAGFATWSVDSTGAAALNNIGLGALGSSAAKTLDVADDGSATIIFNAGDPTDWENLQVISALGTTGALTITGGETGFFGLLSDDTTALKEVLGGTGMDSFDLSAYAGTLAEEEALQINGGGNLGTVVELSNAMINQISAAGSTGFTVWAGVPNLLWVGTDVTSDVSGAMNWGMFPGTMTVTLADNGSGIHPNQSGNIIVTKAPDAGTFNFQDANQNDHNFSITGADTAGGAGNVINVNYENLLNSGGTFASASFDKVDVNLVGNATAGVETFYFGGTTAVANTDASETFTLTAGLAHAGGETILFGNVTSQVLGGNDITLLGGAIIVNPPTAQFSLTGTLDIAGIDNVVIGVTNASAIHSTTTGTFDMTSPDDIDNPGAIWVANNGGIAVSSTSAFSTLQGTLGWNGTGHFALPASNDVLTDLAGHSNFYGDGGADVVNIGGGSNTVHIGEFLLNDHQETLTIDAGNTASLGFWGAASQGEALTGAGSIFGAATFGGTSADMTVVNGFTLGATGDNLDFNVAAFNGGLIDPGNGIPIGPVPTDALGLGFNVGFAGEVISTMPVRVILDSISDYMNAATLAHAMVTGTIGNFSLGFAVGGHSSTDFLVAYEVSGNTGVDIAEVHAVNTSGTATANTASLEIFAQDLVSLPGVTLTGLGLNLGEIHFT